MKSEKKYECSFPLDEHDKKRGKVFVLKSYKRFLDTSKHYELSGMRFICPEHGFQINPKQVISDYDIFGGAMSFIHKCPICDKICLERKSEDYEIKEYVTTEWRETAERENLKIIPFEQVEVKLK